MSSTFIFRPLVASEVWRCNRISSFDARSPFEYSILIRDLVPSSHLRAIAERAERVRKPRGYNGMAIVRGAEIQMQEWDREWADGLPCSQRPHDETVVPRCAQLKAICPSPPIRFPEEE